MITALFMCTIRALCAFIYFVSDRNTLYLPG